jgi:hypothetical protein
MGFDIGNLLQQYLGGAQGTPPDKVADDFQQVAQAAPPAAVGSGVAEALRSDQTPPFAQMVGQLFGNGNSQQRAGMLNQLISGLSPSLLASLGGGLGGLMGGAAAAPNITPEQAAQLGPEQVQQIAARAEQNDPGIIDRMGDFYAAHPTLVKTIGGAALAIVMGKMAERMRN